MPGKSKIWMTMETAPRDGSVIYVADNSENVEPTCAFWREETGEWVCLIDEFEVVTDANGERVVAGRDRILNDYVKYWREV